MIESKLNRHDLILSIDPTKRGFAYILFEGPKHPIDWGFVHNRAFSQKKSKNRLTQLLDYYEPDVIAAEDLEKSPHHRSKNAKELIETAKSLAEERTIRSVLYERATVLDVFGFFHAQSKYEIAKTIIEWLPVLAPHLPPKRKIWMCEDERINLFDAAALALTYYYLDEK